MPHLRESFDPGNGTEFTGSADEIRRDPGTAVGGVNDNPLQQNELATHCLESGLVPASGSTEVQVALLKRNGGRDKHTNADGFVTMPEQREEACHSEMVAAVMPPSEVRPVATGRGREPELVGE